MSIEAKCHSILKNISCLTLLHTFLLFKMDPAHMSKRVYTQFLCLGLKPMVVKANRCTGKTQLACALAAKLAETHRVCIVTSSRNEAQSCLQRVANLLPGSDTAGDCIHFGNGWVKCAKKITDADVLLIDNAQYLDPREFWEDGACLVGKKPMLFIGTPTGNANNILSRMCKLQDEDGARLFDVIDATQRSSSL